MTAEDEYSDDDLLRNYVAGDADAAERLTARLLPRVYAHARRVLRNQAEAEDVAQEVMYRLWKTAPSWTFGDAKVTTWLYRVTVNLCTDRLRQRRGIALDEIDEPVNPEPSAEEVIQSGSRVQALREALGLLPLRQRQAVVLRHLDGLSNPEIGRIMDISPRAVESLTARGKRALAEALGGRKEQLGFENDAP